MPLRSFLAAAMAAALFTAAPVVAQDNENAPSLTVNPGVLTKGSSATIHYSNPDMAGQTVVVHVDNGMRNNTQTQAVEITLDANGEGSAQWNVPDWFGAKFNAPGAPEVFCPVEQ